MSPSVLTRVVQGGAILLVAVAFVVLARSIGADGSGIARLYARYVARLNAKLRVLFMGEQGARIAKTQLALLGLLGAACVAFPVPMAPVWAVLIAALPEVYLYRLRKERVEKLEEQVDGFIVSLANSLKTVPSPAAAMHATVSILPQPTRQEVEQVLKEMRVGSTLEEGLMVMSARVGSRSLDTALSAVLIGLRVGGNLPVVLERTAASIREMNRLMGVVRTKTSEARAQLWVLALFPLFIVGAFSAMSPGFFDPLQTSLYGKIAMGIAMTLWLAALAVARKVMQVDL